MLDAVSVPLRVAWFVGAVLCLQAMTSAQRQEPREALGIVDRANGRWVRPQDKKELIRGDIIFPGQTVSIEFSTSGSISIVLFANGTTWHQICTKRNPCEGSYRPPSPAPPDSGFWTFLKGYWHSELRVPSVFAGARTIGDSGPAHAVLHITNGTVDLRPALANAQPGRYTIVLTRQECSHDSIPGSKQSSTVDWKAEIPTPIPAPAPGLYALEIFSSGKVGSAAAVLVVGDEKEGIEAVWQDVRRRTSQWTDADTGTVDDLLVATLCALHSESLP